MREIIETDVLVIGGGGAGCRAAIEAHDRGARVLMMVKGPLGDSGCTLNVGTSAAVGPWAAEEDSNDISLRDLLSYGGFLGNQDLARVLVDETMDRVTELEEWGIDFARSEDGEIAPTRSAEHSFPRNFTFKPSRPSDHEYGSPPGIAMMDALLEQVRARDIRVTDGTALVDLLTADGRVVGATGLDAGRSRLVVFRAKATVLATGTYSQIFAPTTVSAGETGDGQAAAFRAGAELIDMESSQFVATTTGHPHGSTFLNAEGEPFLEKYGTSASPEVAKEALVYAVWKEIRDGGGTERDTVFVDMRTALQDESVAHFFLPYIEKRMGEDPIAARNRGSDPRESLMEAGPAAHTTIGGVRTDERCETNVPGLYAAGAVAGGVYGLARPEGYTSMITLVFGRRAGLFAAEDSRRADVPALDGSIVGESLDRATALIDNERGAAPDEAKSAIRSALRRHAWVIKDEEGLAEGLAEVRGIGESYTAFRAADGAAWTSALEVPNMLLTAELLLLGSLARRAAAPSSGTTTRTATTPGGCATSSTGGSTAGRC